MIDDKCCGTCKYHYHKNIGDGWECVNDRSEYFADWTEYSDSCDEWEERKQMKYKVGDKVRVREDLNINEKYGFLYAIDEMIKEKIVTIAYVYDGYYGIKEDVFMWTDEMFEGLAEDKLTAEEAIRLKCEMCDGRFCNDCKLSSRNNGMGVKCNVLGKNHPERYIEILKQFKKYYEKKEIETEIVDLIRIMKEEGDSTTCIYAYEIDAKGENIDEKMDKLVKQYYEENGGKIYAKFERVCRVKS
jgi:hypothetical protein